MTSTLKVNTLESASGTTITVPTGKKIVGTDTASIYAPGTCVQMVSLSDTTVTRAASSSTSFVASNITNTITPKFSNSKIIARVATSINNNTNSANSIVVTFYRKIGTGSFSNIRSGDWGITQGYGAASRIQVPCIAEIVDAPATTDAVTYTLYYRSSVGITVEVPATTTEHCEFTLMEIAQ